MTLQICGSALSRHIWRREEDVALELAAVDVMVISPAWRRSSSGQSGGREEGLDGEATVTSSTVSLQSVIPSRRTTIPTRRGSGIGSRAAGGGRH